MEEESNIKKVNRKMLNEKSSDDNVVPKMGINSSDEELGDRQKGLKSKMPGPGGVVVVSRRSARKGKGNSNKIGMSMYSKVKEPPSKRGKDKSKKILKPKLKAKANEAAIRSLYTKTKTRKGKAASTQKEGLMCSEEFSKQCDVPEEYGPETTKAEKTSVDPEVNGVFPMNNENNGHLFIKGVPFWSLKDEKPPATNHVGMSTTLEQMIEKKFILLKDLPEPNNLDPFHEMATMTNRDEEYFKTTNRIRSNTVRSLVGTNELKKSSEVRPPNVSARHSVIGFQIPVNMHVYNRKNRLEPMTTVNFTPGALGKKKKGIFANFIDSFY